MRFLVDECTGPVVANWLKERGHDVFSIYQDSRGASDEEILAKAYSENWILITNDKDFGEKVFRANHPHKGVIFLRLDDERSQSKITVLERLLNRFSNELIGAFVVVTEKQVRIVPGS